MAINTPSSMHGQSQLEAVVVTCLVLVCRWHGLLQLLRQAVLLFMLCTEVHCPVGLAGARCTHMWTKDVWWLSAAGLDGKRGAWRCVCVLLCSFCVCYCLGTFFSSQRHAQFCRRDCHCHGKTQYCAVVASCRCKVSHV